MNDVTPEPIMKIAAGFMAAKHLFAANDLGLFAALGGGPRSLADLTRVVDAPEPSVRVAADAMVSLGLLRKKEGIYENSTEAQVFLSGTTPADMRPFLTFWDQISYPNWEGLTTAMRTRKPGLGKLSDEQTAVFSRGVEAVTSGAARALPEVYDFSAHRRFLDLGGGTGSFLIPALEKNSGLQATLLESPAVTAVARKRINGSAVRDRISVLDGDFFTDDIPAGHDVILMANVVHLFGHARNIELLGRVRERVAPGAKLLLLDFWTDETRTQPTFAALMAGEFLAVTGEGDVYNEQDVDRWCEASGWKRLDRRDVAGPASLIVCEAV
ncbi:MAG TPA: methyltransferase [Candidatus Saccharimonadales bacterium]|nr:methyltransferase [Candidatus Saccharimonadales bacterium]